MIISQSSRSERVAKTHVMVTVHHECWHVAEAYIDTDLIAELDIALCGHGDGYAECTYAASPIERRARAYAAFATLADEGLPVLVDVGRTDALCMFSAVYNGDFARELQATGII